MAGSEELKDLFVAEALDYFEQLNNLMVRLEKNHEDQEAVNAIFRLVHTMKGNASSMGFDGLSVFAHTIEDVFGLIRSRQLKVDEDLFQILFRSIDLLGELIEQIKDKNKKVRYKGLKRKLEVRVREATKELEQPAENTSKQNTEEDEQSQSTSPEQETGEEQEQEQPSESQNQDQSAGKVEDGPSGQEAEADEEDEEDSPASGAPAISLSDRVSIPISKLDNLLNLVGELLIERDRITNQYRELGKARATEITRLNRITSDLQYGVMDTRLIQVSVLFSKFNRIVRDLAREENKEVELSLEGVDIEIDRNVLQAISESLIHLVRNAIGHGIETKEERTKVGKPQKGHLKLKAFNDRENVIIQVQDDGKGIDHSIIQKKVSEKGLASEEVLKKMTPNEIIQFIFEPGFSSADQITSVSGRGVGMDVVKRSVESIGGNVEVMTDIGSGTIFNLRLPSTMAVKPVMLFTANGQIYGVPLTYLEAVTSYEPTAFHHIGQGWVINYQNQTLPVTFLNQYFAVDHFNKLGELEEDPYQSVNKDVGKCYTLIVNYQDRFYALVVDTVTQQKEIVEKPLSPPLDGVRFLNGSTILGDGQVSLILDVPSLLSTRYKSSLSHNLEKQES